jgi:pSer/pThr/pTyr-binding forkhead associated (FHA) protein/S1-C subfamily serine protease
MKVVLLYMSGALQGREKVCDALPVRLGADPSGEIFFDAFAHRMVSKLHAVILWENGGWWLHDRSGGKGLQLNGRPVADGGSAPLKMGDKLQLGLEGPVVAAVLLDTEGETPAPPPETLAAPPSPLKSGAAPAGQPAPPLTLEFTEGARQGKKVTFKQPPVTLGRKSDNNLALDHAEDSAASGKHAYIFWAEGRYQIHDHNSTNGTYLNGLRVTTSVLKNGDILQLTPSGIKLKVLIGEPEVESTQPLAATAPAEAPASLTLEFVSGERKGQKLNFTQPEVRLGRKPENDVTVGDKQSGISSEHALIKYVNGDYLLIDTNSTNGTYLDGKKIETQPLHDGAVIRLTAWGPELKVMIGGGGGKTADPAASIAGIPAAQRKSGCSSGLLVGGLLVLFLVLLTGGWLVRSHWKQWTGALRGASSSAGLSTSGNDGSVPSGSLSKSEIFSRNQQGVVFIRHVHINDGREQTTEGTGFCVNGSGLIITNRHVGAPWSSAVAGGSGAGRTVRIEIFFAGSRESRPGRLLREHPDSEVDLAALQVEGGKGLPAVSGLELNDETIHVGDEAYIIGFPLGSATYSEGGVMTPSFTAGTISKKTSRRLQYDAATFPGSSGSPVFDDAGKIIAVHFAGQANGAEKAAGINYGIPVQYVQELLKGEAEK